MQREVGQIRKNSLSTIGNALISNSQSVSSLISNTNSLTLELDSLTKEQLILRCQREISMKEIEREQNFDTVFKLELQSKNDEINEKERRLQQYEWVLFF